MFRYSATILAGILLPVPLVAEITPFLASLLQPVSETSLEIAAR
jgi:hypothetical protein